MRFGTARRGLEVLKKEGLSGIGLRIKSRARGRFACVHLLVLAFDSNQLLESEAARKCGRLPDCDTDPALRPPATKLSFKEIFLNDGEDIDGLTAIDPWNIPRSDALKKLHDKWRCYVAKSSKGVVACAWVVDSSSFNDEFLKRQFHLGVNEVYYTRGFATPASRGQGIFPKLMAHITNSISLHDQKTHHLTLVRTSNRAVQRSLAKIGWKVVGRAGFIEALGIRFQYLWGREAFRETKQRVFLQLNRKGS